jgi:hypothetical protein
MDTKTARIRALNDELRQHLTGGMAVITPGVAALGPEAVERIVKTIAVFDDFCHANDPLTGPRQASRFLEIFYDKRHQR